jgi:folylpolyglutamate synthase
VHVAGTNGKGSVCAYLTSLLVANTRGFKVGRFTSPHLLFRHDCVTINDAPVDSSKFHSVEQDVLQIDKQFDIGATEFEILTAVALQIFKLEQVDLAVMEVGLGGRLDSTNVLEPARLGKDGTTIFGKGVLVTGITKIGFDHEAILGNTITEIAQEKAGIIKRSITNIVDGTNEPGALNAIAATARALNAHNYVVNQDSELIPTPFGIVDRKWSPLKGFYQLQNLSVSLKIFEVLFPFLQENFPFQCNFSLENIQRGIQSVSWPGRLQNLQLQYSRDKPSLPILLDGAHNGSAAKALAEFLRNTYEDEPITFIIAVTKGKDLRPLLGQLVRAQDRIIVTKFGPVDGMPWITANEPEDLKQELLNYTHNVLIERDYAKSFEMVTPGENIVVCGSLYLVGEVLRLHKANLE